MYFGSEMTTCFDNISVDSQCRSVILSGAGKIFSAGQRFCSAHHYAFIIYIYHHFIDPLVPLSQYCIFLDLHFVSRAAVRALY